MGMRLKKSEEIVGSLTSLLQAIYRRVHTEFWSHQQLIDHKQSYYYPLRDRLKGKNNLPKWAECELYGVDKLLFHQLQNSLIWTHVLDGQRYFSRSSSLDGRLSDIEEDSSDHCYGVLLGDKIVWMPFTQSHREMDIKLGILDREDCIRCTKVVSDGSPLFKKHKLNGSVEICRAEPIPT